MSTLQEQLSEIPEYLRHENADVRAQALEILKGFSVEEEHIKVLKSLNVVKAVIRLVSDEPKVSTAALTLLVNLSASDEIRSDIVTAGVVNVCMEFLVSAVNVRASRLALMILNNVTLDSQGAIDAMQEGKPYEGLHATRLFRWFNDRDLARADGDDWALAGHILCNLSLLESGRKLIVDPKRQFLLHLCDHIRSESADRRLSALRMIHNISHDVDKQFVLLDPAARIWPVVLRPIVAYNADGAIDERELKNILPDVQVMLANPTKQYDPDATVRRTVLDIVFALCRNPPARAYLRATNTYHLLREMHKLEREVENDATDVFLDDELIPYFILDETEAEMEPEKAKRVSIFRLERQSQGLTYEEDEEEETPAEEQKPPMAMLAPDEDGEIEDARVYNDRMAQMRAAEELAMEERAKKIGKSMYEPKDDCFDPLTML